MSARILYTPNSEKPFQLSRSRLDNFLSCPRCFYLDCREGLRQPPSFPFTLNNAVDRLLKTEFDTYRKKQYQHPIMKKCGIDGVPYTHEQLSDWRLTTTGKGMRYLYPGTNLDIMGSPDDIWLVELGPVQQKKLCVVDYKATSSMSPVHAIEDDWWARYKRQLDIYVWLLKKQDVEFEVSQVGYFLLVNGDSQRKDFNWTLHFEPHIVKYVADDSWVDGAIQNAHTCLLETYLPMPSKDCAYCAYVKSANDHQAMNMLK